MPTLQDVARHAGVSTATVSKVLSNTPYFTEETRLKVMQAVAALNYRPNLAGRALSSGKTEIIAVVFPYVYDALFTDPFVLYMLQGIEAECHAEGYNMLLSTPRLTAAGPDDHYLRLVQSGYVEGMLAFDNVPLASVLGPVHQRHIPCVAIGYHETQYYVRSDDYAGGFEMLQHIVGLGHRRIGLITVPEKTNFSMDYRLAGLRASAEASGLDFARLPQVSGNYSIEGGAAAAKRLLDAYPELTALVCLNDRMAMGAVQQCQALHRRVPEDMAVMGYDNIPQAASMLPPLTTIDQQAPELGRTAARMLFSLLKSHTPEPVILPTQLIVRGSTIPVR
jgi:LacI family transcriptional regulator